MMLMRGRSSPSSSSSSSFGHLPMMMVVVATLLVLLLLDDKNNHHTATAFSLLPPPSPVMVGTRTTTTTRTSTSSTTSLFVSAASRDTTTTSSSSVVATDNNDSSSSSSSLSLSRILSLLEKRIQNGPGSLSVFEVEEMEIHSDRIIQETMMILVRNEKKAFAATTGTTATAVGVVPPLVLPEVVVFNDEVEDDDDEDEAAVVALVEKKKKKHVMSDADVYDLQNAVQRMDAAGVATLLEAGLEMDEATTNMAFWAVVNAVDRAEEQDIPLSADITNMLHHVFDADLQHLLQREKQSTNLTCMQPNLDDEQASARAMNYIFDDSAHKDLPLKEGRRCEDGRCCDACSRNIFPTFCSPAECSTDTFPGLTSLTFNNLKEVPAATILQFARLVERVRRTISHEYGVPLSYILPLQAYSRMYVAGTTQKGGGGGEGDFVTLHTDEATHAGYHYSSVLYLNTQGVDFEGGDFVFNDPAKNKTVAVKKEDDGFGYEDPDWEPEYSSLAEQMRRSGRDLTPFGPTKGSAVIFSSGWENMHEVETITSGTRYVVPCFFTTCPVPEIAYTQMVQGKPKTDEDIADDWLHLLLAHRDESPMEAVGRVKELLMKWHYMCTPLSRHNN